MDHEGFDGTQPERIPSLERSPGDPLLVDDVIAFNNADARVAAYTVGQDPGSIESLDDDPAASLVALGRLLDSDGRFVADAAVERLAACDRVVESEKPTARLLSRVSTGDDARVWLLRGPIVEKMRAVFEGENQDWSGTAQRLIDHPDMRGHDVWIVGGAVRDALIGKPVKEINDLDLATTAPPTLVHSLMKTGEVLEDTEAKSVPSDSGVVHVSRPGGEPFIQCATLKLAYRRAAKRWDFGSDFEADLRHRDLTINSLFYNPRNHLLIDPSGRGLAGLGIRPQPARSGTIQILHYEGNETTSPVELRIPSLEDLSITSPTFLLQQFMRLLKALYRYPESDCEPARQWLKAHDSGFVDLLAKGDVDSSVREREQAKARTVVRSRARAVVGDLRDAGVTRLGRFHKMALERLATGQLGYLEDLIDLAVEGLLGESAVLTTRGSSSQQTRAPAPSAIGTGLRFAHPSEAEDHFDMGGVVAELANPSPTGVNETFGIELRGFRHERLSVLTGYHLEWVLGLTDDASWYVETGDFDRPLRISEAGLERVLDADRLAARTKSVD